MHVRTNLVSGETTPTTLPSPVDALNTAVDLYQTASNVVGNALTDPNALKLFMNYLPPADQ
jgi:hypothetical protein